MMKYEKGYTYRGLEHSFLPVGNLGYISICIIAFHCEHAIIHLFPTTLCIASACLCACKYVCGTKLLAEVCKLSLERWYMQTYQHISMFLHRYIKGSLVGKFSIGVILGLLLLVATFVVNVPGASAHSRYGCSNAYTVVRGDTLSRIGSRYGVRWSVLASYNRITNPNLIYVGQTVCIPARGTYSYAPARVPVKQNRVTPYVAPRPAPAASGSVASMIYQVFGSYGSAAINVARCESGLNPGAYNRSGASGVFQIMPGTWAGTSEAGASPFNAYANIVAAHQIFVRDGYSWREWTCQP